MDPERSHRHWADEVADAVLAEGRAAVLSTGISPSGEIHVGNLREVLTADAVHRALVERGTASRFEFVCDNFDPLRRVYPFLDRARYESMVGRPLSDIPCPCGAHPSYAEHFLAPFAKSLERLHIGVEIVRADALYRSGRMTDCIVAALSSRVEIQGILAALTGKEADESWSPFQPLCPACGRISQARVTSFSAREQTVDYACACGSSGRVPMAGGGKLTWRVDWPARWKVLGVSVEPFGKDHATRGGSYDTGVRIAREVFGAEPPLPIPYEWIALKGRGDMSSSKGNVLSVAQALEVVPPDALRYLVLRERPQRSITFDPGLPILKLLDEMEDPNAPDRDERALELSRAAGYRPTGVPFRHLVIVAQAANYDVAGILAILHRNGYPGLAAGEVGSRLPYLRRWLEEFAPDDVRFEVQRELPAEVATLSVEQKRFLGQLALRLREEMDGEQVHALVYELAAAFPGVKPAHLFQAIYVSLLGKTRGPRAGWFVAALGPAFCAERFARASEAQGVPS